VRWALGREGDSQHRHFWPGLRTRRLQEAVPGVNFSNRPRRGSLRQSTWSCQAAPARWPKLDRLTPITVAANLKDSLKKRTCPRLCRKNLSKLDDETLEKLGLAEPRPKPIDQEVKKAGQESQRTRTSKHTDRTSQMITFKDLAMLHHWTVNFRYCASRAGKGPAKRAKPSASMPKTFRHAGSAGRASFHGIACFFTAVLEWARSLL